MKHAHKFLRLGRLGLTGLICLFVLLACSKADKPELNKSEQDQGELSTQACSRPTVGFGYVTYGEDVRYAQNQLLARGNSTVRYYINAYGGADAWFGTGTYYAVRAYQRQINQLLRRFGEPQLSVNGLIDSATWAWLGCHSAVPAGGTMHWPATGSANSEIGMRLHPIHGDWRMHRGRDISAPTGRYVYAAFGGTVTCVCYQAGGAGNYVVIDHGNGYETLYMHLNSFDTYQGATVLRGRLIGRVGSTGGSTGPHLHFEVRRNGAAIDWDNSVPYGTWVTAGTAMPYSFAGLR